jgi:hypothetical protein
MAFEGEPMTIEKTLRLQIELVPRTCWYKNLRNQMKRSDWDKLRRKVYADQGYLCCICGADGSGKAQLHCHEAWHYNDLIYVQTLTGFHATCPMCHHVEHFGLAKVLASQGKLNLENVIQHFMKVNQVTREKFDAHRAEAFSLWEERSLHQWKLDLGKWANLATIKVDQDIEFL